MNGKGDDGLPETTETPSADPTGVPGNGNGVPGNGNGKGVGADPAIPEEPGKAMGHPKPKP
jgi:hypothetical protein